MQRFQYLSQLIEQVQKIGKGDLDIINKTDLDIFLKRNEKHMFKTKTSVHGAFTHNRETGNKHLSTTGWIDILSYTHMTEYSERQQEEGTINIHSDVNESQNNYAT